MQVARLIDRRGAVGSALRHVGQVGFRDRAGGAGGGIGGAGGVSADGSQLWLSGRTNAVVYVFATATGKLLKKIPVGLQPHGLCLWPQPGRFSLGHTGNMR